MFEWCSLYKEYFKFTSKQRKGIVQVAIQWYGSLGMLRQERIL